MILAAHSESMHELLVSSPPSAFDNPLSHSKIVVTDAILDEYEARFEDPNERQLLTSFISALAASARLKLLPMPRPMTVADRLNPHYVEAARYGGRNLAIGSGQVLHAQDIDRLAQLGIRVDYNGALLGPRCVIGFEPFETHHLAHDVSQDPSIIERFFRGEDLITFYDKFINRSSVDAMIFLCQRSDPAANILVVTSQDASMGVAQIRADLAVLAPRRVSVELADAATTARHHERYAFVGRHVQVHFPRGIDCFGRAPAWRNSASVIHLYDCFGATRSVKIGFRQAGAQARRPLSLSAVVAG